MFEVDFRWSQAFSPFSIKRVSRTSFESTNEVVKRLTTYKKERLQVTCLAVVVVDFVGKLSCCVKEKLIVQHHVVKRPHQWKLLEYWSLPKHCALLNYYIVTIQEQNYIYYIFKTFSFNHSMWVHIAKNFYRR